ncbi:unnamed protein product [Rotaria sordida]|uniref:Uncharacterized protein n=1 Tax=Rotaria sordida TaxID=392033 RepID=A0A815BYF2_9BILA|nr:unnamed protein product [Rotaria sordida]CAF4119432.1 unnamed protein product [Rotaria sordida]
MGNILELLKKHVFRRREANSKYSRSQPDHPERLPVDKLTTIENVTQEPNQLPISTTTQTVASSNVCSDFYLACRHNNLDEVQKLLPTMTLDDVDRMEPNGSTALHAASYHGHQGIVKFLLENGANRAIPNKYKCLPYDEAKNDDIKELFLRMPNSDRLVSSTGAIEWELIDDDDVLGKAVQERHIIKSLYDNVTKTTPIDKMFENIEKNYINKGLNTIGGIEKIRRFFRQATEKKDPIWIITAYTAETDFYRVLNTEIATGTTKYQSERRYIIALISHHHSLEKLTFIGDAYRVMQINNDDLKKYQIDHLLMTKSFLSSSIDRKVVELYARQQDEAAQSQIGTKARLKVDGTIIKSWILCKYRIKHRRTALHIEDLSQYANEGEILIMPYSVFKIKKIEQIQLSFSKNVQYVTEIDLEECDQYL